MGLNKKGVTLTELIMVIVIVGVLAGGIGFFVVQAIDIYKFITFRNEDVSQARMAMNRMTREIRMLKDDHSVLTANSTDFEFNDMDGNSIEFQLSGNTLLRNSDILVDGIQIFQFTYWDIQGNELTNPAVSPDSTDIWRICIRMSIQTGDESMTIKSQAHPRNLFRQ